MLVFRLGRTGRPTSQKVQLGRPAARVNGCRSLCQDECSPVSYGSLLIPNHVRPLINLDVRFIQSRLRPIRQRIQPQPHLRW